MCCIILLITHISLLRCATKVQIQPLSSVSLLYSRFASLCCLLAPCANKPVCNHTHLSFSLSSSNQPELTPLSNVKLKPLLVPFYSPFYIMWSITMSFVRYSYILVTFQGNETLSHCGCNRWSWWVFPVWGSRIRAHRREMVSYCLWEMCLFGYKTDPCITLSPF